MSSDSSRRRTRSRWTACTSSARRSIRSARSRATSRARRSSRARSRIRGASPRRVQPRARPPRAAYLAGYPWTTIDRDAADTLDAAVARARARRAPTVVAVELPAGWHDADLVHRTIMMCEGAAALARSAAARAATDVRRSSTRRSTRARAISRADYEDALRRRAEAIADIVQWLVGFDAIISPPATGAAPEGLEATGDPACCTLWSLLGFSRDHDPDRACAATGCRWECRSRRRPAPTIACSASRRGARRGLPFTGLE